jgi:hypothetical protein
VQESIEKGVIHPEMQTVDVRLLAGLEPNTPRAHRAKQRDESEKRSIKRELHRLWERFPKHRSFFINEVRALEAAGASERGDGDVEPPRRLTTS